MTSQIPFTPVTPESLARLTAEEREAFKAAAAYVAHDQKPPLEVTAALLLAVQRLIAEPEPSLATAGTREELAAQLEQADLDQALARWRQDRERADAAEARLAAVQRVIGGFLDRYGASTLPAFKVAAERVAESVRAVLKGSGVAAREAVAAAERQRLLAVLADRKVTLSRPGLGYGLAEQVDVVPWAAVRDLLKGLPTTGCEEVRDV